MDKDVVHIYNRILLSHKKEWNNAIYSNLDATRDYYTKWNKSENDKYHLIALICGIWNKAQINIYKIETDSDMGNRLEVAKVGA